MNALSDEAFFALTLKELEEELDFDDAVFADTFVDSIMDDGFLKSLGSPPSSPASSSDEVPATDPDKKLKVFLKASRYRNRKREELEGLRSAVKTLEVRLAALQSRAFLTTEPMTSYPFVWETLALLESQQRQEAEHKNKELREFVQLHYQLARKLDDMMKRMSEHVSQPRIANDLLRP